MIVFINKGNVTKVLLRPVRQTLHSNPVFHSNANILPFFHYNASFHHSKINIKAIFQ